MWFVWLGNPWFDHSGDFTNGTGTGVFAFGGAYGSSSAYVSFRKFTKIKMYEIKIYLSIKFYFIEKQIKEKNRDFIGTCGLSSLTILGSVVVKLLQMV